MKQEREESLPLDPQSILPCDWYVRKHDGMIVVVKRKNRDSVDYSPVDIEEGTWQNTVLVSDFCRDFLFTTEDDM